MKYLIHKKIGIIILLLIIFTAKSYGQKIVNDPILTGAIWGLKETEEGLMNEGIKQHKKIVQMQAVVAANLNIMKGYEEKIYGYLSNVSDAIKQGHEVVRASELTAKIIKATRDCMKAAKNYPQGLVYTAIVSRKTTKITTEMIGIYSYITNISLNKKTLLNSAQRQMIIDDVVFKLERIHSDLRLIQFQIENHSICDLPQVLLPELYYMTIDGKDIADKIINDFSK